MFILLNPYIGSPQNNAILLPKKKQIKKKIQGPNLMNLSQVTGLPTHGVTSIKAWTSPECPI